MEMMDIRDASFRARYGTKTAAASLLLDGCGEGVATIQFPKQTTMRNGCGEGVQSIQFPKQTISFPLPA